MTQFCLCKHDEIWPEVILWLHIDFRQELNILAQVLLQPR